MGYISKAEHKSSFVGVAVLGYKPDMIVAVLHYNHSRSVAQHRLVCVTDKAAVVLLASGRLLLAACDP